MTRQILLDADGVLFDFIGGANKVHEFNPGSVPSNIGHYWPEDYWGKSKDAFWFPLNNVEFWATLDKTPEADQIVALAIREVGEANVAICTKPSDHPSSILGKMESIKKNYPMFSERTIFASAKEFLAGPNRILIDDGDKNILAFNKAGGQGVLVPRMWNKGHAWPGTVMENIRMQLRAGRAL